MSPRFLFYIVVVIALGVLPWVEFLVIVHLGVSTRMAAAWCVGAGLIGWWHARKEDLSLWTDLESDLQNRRVPTEEGVDAMLQLLGAWALILPGFVTDVLGAGLLVPQVRALLVPAIREYMRNHWIAA